MSLPITATSAHRAAKRAATTEGEILADEKTLAATRKQIDAAYKRICGIVPARKSKARNNFLFGKKANQ